MVCGLQKAFSRKKSLPVHARACAYLPWCCSPHLSMPVIRQPTSSPTCAFNTSVLSRITPVTFVPLRSRPRRTASERAASGCKLCLGAIVRESGGVRSFASVFATAVVRSSLPAFRPGPVSQECAGVCKDTRKKCQSNLRACMETFPIAHASNETRGNVRSSLLSLVVKVVYFQLRLGSFFGHARERRGLSRARVMVTQAAAPEAEACQARQEMHRLLRP